MSQNQSDKSIVEQSEIMKPSQYSSVFLSKSPMNLRNGQQCVIFTRKGAPLGKAIGKGNCLKDVINARNAVMEHYCTDEPKCMQFHSKKVLAGDITSVKIVELSHKKFDAQYNVLMSSDIS